MRTEIIITVTLLSACSAPALAHEGNSELVEELIVYGRSQPLIGSADAASVGVVGYDDLRLPPLLRVGELVEAVPGMVATQHSGSGKANQYFLRGFNLDHGTDFSAFVDGVPINMRTHGHGQGYLDLNFLIPELVETTSYRKGPYSAQVGDFSSAGSVDFKLYDELEEGILSISAGAFDYYRGLAASTFDVSNGSVTAAVDHTEYSGPWQIDEDLEQTKYYLSYQAPWNDVLAKLSVLGYSGTWNSTDQIPKRAVAAGILDPLGYVDPDLGGRTDRIGLTGQLEFEYWDATAYYVHYDFGLFSNFTYLLDDPVDGDQFEQTDRRDIYGFRIDGKSDWLAGFTPVQLRWGSDLRYDDIDEVALYQTVDRVRQSTVRNDSVDQLSMAAYGELGFELSERLRSSVGLRADYMQWDVDALRAENQGKDSDSIISPKFNLAYRVSDGLELYANWGRGFHSNDVRGTVITVDPSTGLPVDKVDPFVRSNGAEIGARFESSEQFNATMTVFWLELDSELLFVGDAGNTEALDATERNGIEFASFYQPFDWLATNFTYTYTDSKFKRDTGSGRHVPGAVTSSAMLGVNGTWDNGFFASARFRYLGESPLIEDNSVRSAASLLVNAGAGYRMRNFEFRLDVFNLLDSDDDDIAYYYASRLPTEPESGIEDIHFHPLEPRSVRFSVSFHWR
jgi:outer membrane receptor for ferrienterochelin and colicin